MVGGHPRSLEYLDALLSRRAGPLPRHHEPGSAPRVATARRRRGRGAAERRPRARRRARRGRDARRRRRPARRPARLAAHDARRRARCSSAHPSTASRSTSTRCSSRSASPTTTPPRRPRSRGARTSAIRRAARGRRHRHRRPDRRERAAARLLAELTPHLAELEPPPDTAAPTVPEQLPALVGACLRLEPAVRHDTARRASAFFVHRWTASELDRRLTDAGEPPSSPKRTSARADYWRWRVAVWPQDRRADVHDLLEARHHHARRGRGRAAGEVTEVAARRCTTWAPGTRRPRSSTTRSPVSRRPRSAAPRGSTSSGLLAQDRGDYAEAEARYQPVPPDQRATRRPSRHGQRLPPTRDPRAGPRRLRRSRAPLPPIPRDQRATRKPGRHGRQLPPARASSRSDRGDYDEAETALPAALEINERLGNQADMASGYHQLGILAQLRGDDDEAEQRYHQSLEINERLGNQAGMASSYHQLGILAQDRGDYDEAERRYQQALADQRATRKPSRHGQPATTSSGSSRRTAATTRRPRQRYQPIPRDRRATRKPGRHGHQLPPTRDPRAAPRQLRRSRAALPPIPPDQRATRKPSRHGHVATASSGSSARSGAMSWARLGSTGARSRSASRWACLRGPITPTTSASTAPSSARMPSCRR